MNCLNPRKKKIVDAISGEVKEIVFPCGHCINCLHAYQDMWSIRLGEEARKYKQIIFDTLTVNPGHIKWVANFNSPTPEGTLYGSSERFAKWKVNAAKKKFSSFHRYWPRFSRLFWLFLRKTNFYIYDMDKKPIQDWIKRGRQAYHRLCESRGTKDDFSYFLVKEYGHSTSRPHFHALFFGISLADYIKCFGDDWNENFGFNKPVWKFYSPHQKDELVNITKYVSKYCSKGCLESPFVKEGIQPKPWRLISKGIGYGYIERNDFSIYHSPDMLKWFAYHVPSKEVYDNHCKDLLESGLVQECQEYERTYKENRSLVDMALWFKSYKCDSPLFSYLDLSWMTEQDIKKLTVYFDEKGYPHKLPRYYLDKLFRRGNEKNILQFEIQNVLSQSALMHDNKVIQAEALAMGILIPDTWCERDSSTWELLPSTLFMVLNEHLLQQKRKAYSLAERREIRLKNLYNRIKTRTDAPALM